MVENASTGTLERGVLVVDWTDSPVFIAITSADSILEGTVIDERPTLTARYESFVSGCRGDRTVQLACSLSQLGQYRIATVGKFLVPKPGRGRGGGGNPVPFAFLAGIVEIVTRPRPME